MPKITHLAVDSLNRTLKCPDVRTPFTTFIQPSNDTCNTNVIDVWYTPDEQEVTSYGGRNYEFTSFGRSKTVEKRIVIATHAMFSEGIASSLKMIFGDAVPVECITAYVDLSVDYQDKLEKIVSEHDYEHAELVVLTDILGGSVNNEFMGLLDKYNFHLITGLNLALLFEVVTCPAEDLTANLPSIVEQAREHIVLCNELVEAKAAAAADDQLAELNEF